MAISYDQLNDELKKKIEEFETVKQNYDFIVNQRIHLESVLRETELAIEELEKVDPTEVVYKSIGGILIRSKQDKLLDEKKSQKVSLDMKIKTLKQKEERIKNQIKTMSQSIQSELKNQSA
ncbi:MAG: prefoldin subunit beta [Candidatus Lokiarchaeota archaeon]|nr:prefoldin subunit beta [Candidatus Lokiarchaeota archaeon]